MRDGQIKKAARKDGSMGSDSESDPERILLFFRLGHFEDQSAESGHADFHTVRLIV